MGEPHTPERALLFIATLYSEEDFYKRATDHLIQDFGELLFESKHLLWRHSEYYRGELGWPITRRFLTFRKTISSDTIKEIKLVTNELEKTLSVADKRRINLDPGYLTLAKVVLATTKNYVHRVYLGKGIYAEVTLFYRGGSFRAHEFTYKDYGSSEYIAIFHRMREFL